MKVSFSALFFLAFSLNASAENISLPESICDANKACEKACIEKQKTDHDDNDPHYQKLLLKCGEDISEQIKIF